MKFYRLDNKDSNKRQIIIFMMMIIALNLKRVRNCIWIIDYPFNIYNKNLYFLTI